MLNSKVKMSGMSGLEISGFLWKNVDNNLLKLEIGIGKVEVK